MNGLNDLNPTGMLVLGAVFFIIWGRMVVRDLRTKKLRRDAERRAQMVRVQR